MKTFRPFAVLAAAGAFLALTGCDNLFTDGVNTPEETAGADLATLAKTGTVEYEVASMDAGGLQLTDKDAIFSLGWSEFYNPIDATVQERSDAFAFAPDGADAYFGHSRHAGKDMGTVTLEIAGTTLELPRTELHGGVFYNYGRRAPGNPRGAMHADEGEVSNDIPFLPGGVYTFVASGSDVFPAVRVEITAPQTRLQIATPADGGTIAADGTLEITWQGGDASQPVMISVVPKLDPAYFRPGPGQRFHGDQPFNGGQGSRGHGPMGGMGGMHNRGHAPGADDMRPGKFFDLHTRYVLKENTGSFAVPAADLAQILAFDGIQGLIVHVVQMNLAEVTVGDAQYATQVRTGDVVGVNFAN